MQLQAASSRNLQLDIAIIRASREILHAESVRFTKGQGVLAAGGKFLQQGFAFAEPGAFAALHIARQGACFREDFLRPFASFVAAVGGLQEAGVVVERFGRGRDLRRFGE